MGTRIDTATYISGAGHLGLIGWLMLGGIFTASQAPFEVTEVSMISGSEFAALIAAHESPSSTTEVALPQAPEAGGELPDIAPAPDEITSQTAPDVSEAPPPDAAPVEPEPPIAPEAEVEDTAPVLPEPAEDIAVLVPEVSDQAVPRQADRVAPEPTAQPSPETTPSEVEQEAVTLEETGEAALEQQEATAPEKATTQIVTEASEAPSAAPVASIRPPARRPSAPVAVAQAEQTPDAPPDTANSAVNAALAEALGGGDEPVAAPSGPPLSAGERDALRVAVSNCWNVGSLSTEALNTTVIVAVSLTEDSKPVASSIKMLSSSGGTEAAAAKAFGAARRAIIRCGSSGFDLPIEKYSRWRDIEMTFNPEGMRLK